LLGRAGEKRAARGRATESAGVLPAGLLGRAEGEEGKQPAMENFVFPFLKM
jgi:hypothetical protein